MPQIIVILWVHLFSFHASFHDDVQLFKSPHFIPRNVFSSSKRKDAELMMTKTLSYSS